MSFERTHKVSDLIASRKLWIGDGYRAKNTELDSTGIPFARAGDINDGFHFTSGDHLPLEDAWKAGNKLSEAGDVVFTSKGTVGRFGYVTENIQRFVYSPQLCFWRSLDRQSIHPRFLFYWIQGKEFYRQYKSVSQKTDMAEYVSLSDQRSMEMTLPDLGSQKAIAHILSTLDDKIELNRKTNETLEAMAKALFKSWFVDFDPVRAKAEGRPTGLPAEISDLFPDSFEDSELGEIPSGWRVFELGDCSLHIESGTRPKGGIDKNLAFGIPSIGAESISPIGQFDFSKTKWVDAAFAQSAGRGWIQNYDVALYKDGGKPGEFRPRTALYGDGFPFDKAMVNEHVFLLRSSQLGQPYLYYLFNFDLVLAQIIHKGSSKGAQPGLNQEEVRTSSFVKPDKKVLDVFNLTIEPSIRKQLLLGKDCQVLSQLRDALLPKLISGEIRIPDAEKMLEEVGV